MGTRSRALASTLLAIAVGSLPSAASAVAIYSYQGVPFSTVGGFHESGDRVTGELIFGEPLAPNLVSVNVTSALTDFHFNDGWADYTTEGNTIESHIGVILSTDVHGAIVGPYTLNMGIYGGITLEINEFGDTAMYNPGGPCVPGICNRTPAHAGPGQWTQVPEPTSALLLASGLVALASRSRRA